MDPHYPIGSGQNLVLPSLITDPMLLRDPRESFLNPEYRLSLAGITFVTTQRTTGTKPVTVHQPEISLKYIF